MHLNRREGPWRIDTRGVRVSLLRCAIKEPGSSLTNTHACFEGLLADEPSVLCRAPLCLRVYAVIAQQPRSGNKVSVLCHNIQRVREYMM